MADSANTTNPSSRRGFLRGLAGLPMIGGGLALIGSPTAAAVPINETLLKRYAAWCAREHAYALIELEEYHPVELPVHRTINILHRREWVESFSFFGIKSGTDLGPKPSTRAAVVLAAVGKL